MKSTVLKLLLILIHHLYSLVEFMCKIRVYLKAKWNHEDSRVLEDNYLEQNILHIQRIPLHIVVILGTEKPSYKDLANIIIWCVTSGINFISLYDYKGILKKTELELYKAVAEQREDVTQRLAWNKTHSNGIKVNGYTNGTTPKLKHQHYLNIFSLSDGQQDFVRLAKEMALTTKCVQVTTDTLDSYLYERLKLPEPELAVYCGDLCCTYGFLPWHLRITEFVKLQTHHHIQVKTFLNILAKFSKCEQRFGK